MNTSLLVIVLLSASALFAQQTPKSFLNMKKPSQEYSLPYTTKNNLNLDIFNLEKNQQATNSLSEFLLKKDGERSKAIDNMPIFSPKGKFYLEISPVEEDIDYKLNIFSLEKSK